MSDIILHDISKSYPDKIVFSHLDLVIPGRKTTVIIGPSGCGKTTLFRLLMGLEKLDKGEIKGLKDLQKSAVFQEDRLLENLSVSRNIRLPVSMNSSNHDEIMKEIHQNLEEVNLPGIENKPVRELSGGMKRRISVLRALMIPADIFFFDEACNGLDPLSRQKVISLIQKKTINKTVLFITHDSSEADLLKPAKIIHL